MLSACARSAAIVGTTSRASHQWKNRCDLLLDDPLHLAHVAAAPLGVVLAQRSARWSRLYRYTFGTSATAGSMSRGTATSMQYSGRRGRWAIAERTVGAPTT